MTLTVVALECWLHDTYGPAGLHLSACACAEEGTVCRGAALFCLSRGVAGAGSELQAHLSVRKADGLDGLGLENTEP